MDFQLTVSDRQQQQRAAGFAATLGEAGTATGLVRAATDAGVLDVDGFLSAAVVVAEIAERSADAGLVLALHLSVALGEEDPWLTARLRRDGVGAMALSADDTPVLTHAALTGTAAWVGPLADDAVAIVGVSAGGAHVACAVEMRAPGVHAVPIPTAALRGWTCARVEFDHAPCRVVGSTVPFMARARALLAAVGVGMGRRALQEALRSARGLRGRDAGGEQTVQGLLADAATELDAATMLLWKASSAPTLSLADASMAKLAATEAAQRAVSRATQVVGVDSFCRDHVLERLAQDVRALELLAGRTEALREAVAAEYLPQPSTT